MGVPLWVWVRSPLHDSLHRESRVCMPLNVMENVTCLNQVSFAVKGRGGGFGVAPGQAVMPRGPCGCGFGVCGRYAESRFGVMDDALECNTGFQTGIGVWRG